ncbi:RNA polymerase III (C) subunit [Scheffersomyces amazonensis]|uniref:RNA polymerase III (C) subunit n=1 Tax=Scheffersomyces amazonensis TaxID=1078765 RepID=UPI00315DE1DD
MSNRLESLNSKKAPSPAPKVALKFKPKVVPRKSKEERAKDAPIQVKEESSGRLPAGNGRGRGSGRGRGRGGRNNYAGTHLVSSGPLSSGSVSLGNASGSKLGFTKDRAYNTNSVSSTPEFIQNLRLKEGTSSKSPGISGNGNGNGNVADESDDDDDITKIDMTKQYRFNEEDTQLFPVRPERQDDQGVSAPASRESTPVKEEMIDDGAVAVAVDTPQPEVPAASAAAQSYPSNEEHDKLLTDHHHIVDLLADRMSELNTDNDQEDEEFILFQLPKILPQYQPKSTVKAEDPTQNDSPPSPHIHGHIGHFNIHQSGKVSINIGNDINLDVTNGAPTTFLQELIVLNVPETESVQSDPDVEMANEQGQKVKGNIIRLGKVDGKIIATPSFV